VDHIAFPVFDVGMIGFVEQMGSDVAGGLMKLARPMENLPGRLPERMKFQSGLVVKTKIVLFFFPKGFEKILLEEAV
jgi:hypothetical protein